MAKGKPDSRLVKLLDLWANKSGFFSQAYYSRVVYRDHFDHKDDQTKMDEIDACWVRLTTYVAGADGLSNQEKDLLIKSQIIWSDYDESGGMEIAQNTIHEGLNMNKDQVIKCQVMLQNAFKESSEKLAAQNLYFTLTLVGVDGVSSDEKNRFVDIGKSLNIDENYMNDIFHTYSTEIMLGDKLGQLLGGITEPKQIEVFTATPDTFNYWNNFIPIIGFMFYIIFIAFYNSRFIEKIRKKVRYSKIKYNNETDIIKE